MRKLVAEMDDLPRETLIELIRMHGKNWFTLDGTWFRLVEEKFGLEAALELDFKMWQNQGRKEAGRIKEILNIQEKGARSVLKAISFLTSMQSTAFFWEYEEREERIYVRCTHCVPQESRVRNGLKEFPCKPMGLSVFEGVVEIIDPQVRVTCLTAPPGPHPQNIWCEWEFFESN